MVGISHTLLGFSSLIFSISVFIKPKGTRLHKCLGRLYLLSMLGLIISLFELFDTFGIFHFASLVSLWSISMGFRAVTMRHQKDHWLNDHLSYMACSYIGLLGATSNEIYANISYFNQLAKVHFSIPLASLAIIFIVGGLAGHRLSKQIAPLTPQNR
jgi:uncharacterized membrane protein